MGIENDELRGRETGFRTYVYDALDLGAYGLSPIVRVMRTSQGRWGGDSGRGCEDPHLNARGKPPLGGTVRVPNTK